MGTSPQMENRKTELIDRSVQLQAEINSVFAELSDLNRQVRIDIDDFCNIYENSLLNANDTTNVTTNIANATATNIMNRSPRNSPNK
ncbi:uncharacterized protein RNJ42_00684 [Nakaseomyces bracarensis]|uniref:uncharacterized protein n=1 Tax=Nakaseomyces bracarensis TaxID=273131 RepID=UPI0038711B75